MRRLLVGWLLLMGSVLVAGLVSGEGASGRTWLVVGGAWMIGVVLTHKYIHKYPQRYGTCLLATHLKAAVVMAGAVWCGAWLWLPAGAMPWGIWGGVGVFMLLDLLMSVPCRRDSAAVSIPAVVESIQAGAGAAPGLPVSEPGAPMELSTVLERLEAGAGPETAAFLRNRATALRGDPGELMVVDDIPPTPERSARSATTRLMVGRTRINHVRRLNLFLAFCASRLEMGGYLVVRYVPVENMPRLLRRRHPGIGYGPAFLAHMVWHRWLPKIPWLDRVYFFRGWPWLDRAFLAVTGTRNRVLSRAEVWGRLSYHGMNVLMDEAAGDERFVLARRDTAPVTGRRPSYYLIAPLEKVGLGGEILHTHKIRTMYPFSEFVQKRVFEDHGLTAEGKFANDFRLTRIGMFLRKYWLDELPQLADWLRGDVKLVGIRATSRHFLSLYPRDFLELYLQVKPGLIPPIFDANTNGFPQIVEIERTYLRRYWEHPVRTDCVYLVRTLTDILFRGKRSK